MIIGVHNSIKNGLSNVIDECIFLKTNASQIFLHSPRVWDFKGFKKAEIKNFKDQRNKINLKFLAVHSSYLINPLSENKDTIKKSIKLMEKELYLTKSIDADYYVMHIRENKKLSVDENLKNLEAFFKKIKIDYNKILLENSANGIGSSVKMLVYILERLENICGICIDTAHLFEKGYDIREKKGIEKILDELRDLKNLKMIHMNDSKTNLSSKIDRHEHIAKGKIRENGFKNFFSFDYFRNLPIILETPKKGLEDDLINLDKAKKIISSSL